jgi:hypothetical protein
MTLSRLAKQDISSAVKTGLIYFSAVHLATKEFLFRSFPSPDVLVLPRQAIFGTMVIVLIIPFFLLLALDWYVRHRFSPKAVWRLRTVVMAGALILQLRQAQLYLGLGREIDSDLRAMSAIYPTLAMVSLSVALVLLAFRLHRPFRTFFYYYSPIALFLTIVIPFTFETQNQRFDNYSAREVEGGSPSLDPIYIIVFDEFSYSPLLDEDGEIDAEMYPNFAKLGSESLQLTNATGNFFHTWIALPELIDATLSLSNDYEVRLYEQTHRIAAYYADGCGHTYTCRDVNYVRQRNKTQLALSVVARTFYAAAPDAVEAAGRGLLHPILRSIGTISPSSDGMGVHLLTEKMLDQYLNDIESENPNGRVFFLHTLLPHFPYVFNAEGEFSSDRGPNFARAKPPTQEEFDRTWPAYKEQIRYADRFLGEVIDALKREGVYDRATLIVTSDHGLRLGFPTGDQAIEVPSLTPEVPMFIRSPRVQPRKSDIDYQHADFGVTLMDLAGITSPALLAPRDDLPRLPVPVSALSANRPLRDKVFYAEAEAMYWRYVYNDALGTWENVETIDHPIGDRTSLTGRK